MGICGQIVSAFETGLILLTLSAPAVRADEHVKAPPGSYQLSCVMFEVQGKNLRATCQSMDDRWMVSELKDFPQCKSDIQNINGKLFCGTAPIAGKEQSGHAAFIGDIRELDQDLPALEPPAGGGNWQVVHDTWTFRDGAPENVTSLAQTSDGYLWVASTSGLYRFDGRQFEAFHSISGDQLLSTNLYCLFAPATGGLWVTYTFGGASFVDNGRVKNYGGKFEANSGSIVSMIQDKDGVMWAVSVSSGLWRLAQSDWEHLGDEWNVAIKSASDLGLDRDGDLWVSGDGKVLRLRRGSRRFEVVRDNLGTYPRRYGLSGRLLDREGSFWFAGLKGIDRFFYSPLVNQELPEGGGSLAVAEDDEGGFWIGSGVGSGKLYRVVNGEAKFLREANSWHLSFAYRGLDGSVWLGASGGGLWHETRSHRAPVGKTERWYKVRKELWDFTGRDWEEISLPAEAADLERYLQAITEDRQGGMWVSLGRHGLYRMADGVWTAYGGRKDIPTSGIVSEFTDSLGRVWFGYTKNQIAVLDGDTVRVFGPDDGLQVGNVTAIQGRSAKVWIGGEMGIAQFDAGRFKSIHAATDDWLKGISGIVETANGDLWLNGLSGVFHIRQAELAEALKDPAYQVKGDHFGRQEGLPGFATQIRPLPTAVEGSDGRIWFAVTNGVVWVDPNHAEKSVHPPPISIQSVYADDRSYELTPALKFPAHTSSVQINYGAVSLSNPAAIRFRYKLREADRDWHLATAASPVIYRNLAPGSYHFAVNASDTNGQWGDKIASVEFSILPAFYQTTTFRLLSAMAFLALLGVLYQMRLKQLARQFNARLEERVGERIRIARELHDTLLQSFQALLLRFQSVSNRLPIGESKERLDDAIDEAAQAIAEGRDAVQGLRSSTTVTNDLAAAVNALGLELAANPLEQNSPGFEVDVEGKSRDLHPILRDEVYRIVGEALRNAFRHAKATRIEVEIHYDTHELRLRVRDNGRGIEPEVRRGDGRAGHFGLHGMRERAKLIGGNLELWSNVGSGTEVELTIPASTAYARPAAHRRAWLFGRQASGSHE
jgi:signal transduction histidine kinase/ligand-binding sensor domain-containing protein